VLVDEVTALAAAAGLIGPGITVADSFPEVAADLEAARAEGRSAGLGFTFTDPGTSADPRASFPWAASVLTFAHAYLPAGGTPGPARSGTGVVARFATEDHYRPLRAGLGEVDVMLRERGHRAEVLCDDNRLVDRAAAVRSGLAWWGKSAMALMPGTGPWALLGSVVTDAVIAVTPPMRRDCGTCDACIPACPTDAIVAPGVLDARRCLAAILQGRGSIPTGLRTAVGDRIYGCDECLVACPPGDRLLAATTARAGRVDLISLLATADRPLRRRHPHFYLPGNRTRFLRRNAIVALGNGGDRAHTLVLSGLLGHPDPLLRAHAGWALGQVGGAVATAALRARAGVEADPEVMAEIDSALGTLA
jgi:epoxyqueuosine reductase